jgi:hypothetical protein
MVLRSAQASTAFANVPPIRRHMAPYFIGTIHPTFSGFYAWRNCSKTRLNAVAV